MGKKDKQKNIKPTEASIIVLDIEQAKVEGRLNIIGSSSGLLPGQVKDGLKNSVQTGYVGGARKTHQIETQIFGDE